MTISSSSRTAWGISRNSGSTWTDFPKFPNGAPWAELIVPPDKRLDGTRQLSTFATLTFTFDLLTEDQFMRFYRMYDTDAADQVLLLNYRGVGSTLSGGLYRANWYYAPAIFATPPTARPGPNDLYYDVTVVFDEVEWYLPY